MKDAAQRIDCVSCIVERLMDWSDAARFAGRVERAERLLFLAWAAYDAPLRPERITRRTPELRDGTLVASRTPLRIAGKGEVRLAWGRAMGGRGARATLCAN